MTKSKIKFLQYGHNMALVDVTLDKEYEVVRFLNEGDTTKRGAYVRAGLEGVEFIDDVGDVVSYVFNYLSSKYEIITDQVH